MTHQEINPQRARDLRATGMTWRAVAQQLSIDAERHPGFQPMSVQRAVLAAFGTSVVPVKRRLWPQP